MMHIGFDAKRAYHNNTGLGNYSRDLISGLLSLHPSHTYHLYTPELSNNPRIDVLQKHDNCNIHQPDSWFGKCFKGYWRSVALEDDLIRDGISVFHGLSNEIPRKKTGKVKYVVSIHDLIFLHHPETYRAIDRKIYNRKFRYAALNADKVIAISKQTKRDLVEFYGVDPDRIRVIYQSCNDNFKRAYSAEEKEFIRAKYNLPEEYLLYVGTIEARKNLGTVVKALQQVPDIPLVVCGRRTPYFGQVEATVNELGLEKRVLFYENVDFPDLPGFYQMATLFVYPSIFEGFGIPIIEAMYSKIPVITSKGGVFPETGGGDSVYVDPNNVEELETTINELLTDSHRCRRISEKGWDYVQRFSTANFVNQTMEVYGEVNG
ncbi:MAG: glycosyltransferase family 4 protein [Gemmatimonadales bacterium]|nr:glycosyltransferase family 4 protein [Gemmatimonadales bacterium]